MNIFSLEEERFSLKCPSNWYFRLLFNFYKKMTKK
jgi:hypothetical protein